MQLLCRRLEEAVRDTLGQFCDDLPDRGDGNTADLREAYHEFLRFHLAGGGTVRGLIRTSRVAAEGLIRYIQHLHDTHGTLQQARYAILGCQTKHRALKGRLTAAWDSIRSWQLEAAPSHASQGTLSVVVADINPAMQVDSGHLSSD